jgi:hypothetical protein
MLSQFDLFLPLVGERPEGDGEAAIVQTTDRLGASVTASRLVVTGYSISRGFERRLKENI